MTTGVPPQYVRKLLVTLLAFIDFRASEIVLYVYCSEFTTPITIVVKSFIFQPTRYPASRLYNTLIGKNIRDPRALFVDDGDGVREWSISRVDVNTLEAWKKLYRANSGLLLFLSRNGKFGFPVGLC